jgi:hypothetical protein
MMTGPEKRPGYSRVAPAVAALELAHMIAADGDTRYTGFARAIVAAHDGSPPLKPSPDWGEPNEPWRDADLDLDLFKRIDDDLNPSAWVRWGVGVGCALMGAFFVTASWLAYALFSG